MVAQLAVQHPVKVRVAGSNPAYGALADPARHRSLGVALPSKADPLLWASLSAIYYPSVV